MKLKFVPWLVALASLVCLGIVYNKNQEQVAELAQARQTAQELEQLRASLNDTNQTAQQGANDELTRLREENKDVLRLRNEVRQLKQENQQLKTQAQAAQAKVQTAQAQTDALRATAAQASAQAQQAEANARSMQQATLCLNNLRQIQAAIQQWATETSKNPASRVTMADIDPYLRTKPLVCPANGFYTLTIVSAPPTCSIPGHTLSKTP